jgi:hypothetical protein
VNGDPTSDIASTRDIAMVWLAGVPVDRNKLLEKKSQREIDGVEGEFDTEHGEVRIKLGKEHSFFGKAVKESVFASLDGRAARIMDTYGPEMDGLVKQPRFTFEWRG